MRRTLHLAKGNRFLPGNFAPVAIRHGDAVIEVRVVLVECVDHEAVTLANLPQASYGRVVLGRKSHNIQYAIAVFLEVLSVCERRHVSEELELRYLARLLQLFGRQGVCIRLQVVGDVIEHLLVGIESPVASF